ncbi:hypothetical protein Tco_1214045 [Tanacetum coccineum]
MFNSFHACFIEGNQPRPLYSSNLFKQLFDEDSHILDCSFTIEEINEAVLNFGSSKASVNSSPTKEFKIERRLRQGDLLSPFLIILAMESFNMALLEASTVLLSGVSMWGKRLRTDFGRPCKLFNSWLKHLEFPELVKSSWGNYGCWASQRGSPTKMFKIERRLHQGDLLSPFLIILAIEAFNVALLEASNWEWSRSNAMNLLWILTCFHLSSILKANFNKSKLYGIGASNMELNSLASTISSLDSQFPCIYLGLLIGANMSRCNHWSLLFERFPKRISN